MKGKRGGGEECAGWMTKMGGVMMEGERRLGRATKGESRLQRAERRLVKVQSRPKRQRQVAGLGYGRKKSKVGNPRQQVSAANTGYGEKDCGWKMVAGIEGQAGKKM